MKKTIIKAVAVAAVALAARSAMAAADSYLYWMVGDTVKNLYHGIDVSSEWDYAKVRVGDGDTYLSWYNQGDMTTAQGNDKLARLSDTTGTSAAYWGMLDQSATEQTITFELWADGENGGTMVEYLTQSIGALKDFIYTNGSTSGATAYTLTGVVPEPTSGLLMLFGLAGLALRRKRRV